MRSRDTLPFLIIAAVAIGCAAPTGRNGNVTSPSASPTPAAVAETKPTGVPSPTGTPKYQPTKDDLDDLAGLYEIRLGGAFPNLNGIKVKVVKNGSGYALVGYHSFFSKLTFDIGPQKANIEEFAKSFGDELRDAHVTKLGAASTSGLGTSWIDLP